MDPLTFVIVGVGALTLREMNRKDYGVLTPSRDERYRNMMEYCHQPEMLIEEAKLFHEYGLKAQSSMLRRRAEWRARPSELKEAHEEIYQKALKSENIPAILEVAAAFEGWTATKKAATLRERVRVLQEKALEEMVGVSPNHEDELPSNHSQQPKTKVQRSKKDNGAKETEPFTDVEVSVAGEE